MFFNVPLFKVQDDLHHLKEQIISHGVTTEVVDLKMLESVIERTERSVRVSSCFECKLLIGCLHVFSLPNYVRMQAVL